ncbi:MAG TPA: DUF4340 domain-containing protein [Candidatus Acidoferrum sp.]|nr:DUF4340 domain-containing protein [Candidatus Acidoferrum sp.]
MNWRGTWLLVGIATALFAFIFLFEQHLPTGEASSGPQAILADFKAGSARTLQVRYGTKFVVALERTNDAWRYVKPFTYSAATLKVESFLRGLDDVLPSAYITPQEIVARKQTRADFGFDAPAIHVSLESANGPHALQFGARTPAGDQIYLQVDGKPGIYVVSTAILDRLPRTQNDWRETSLFGIPEQNVDRLEVIRAGGGGFALQRDSTNKLWRLTRPAHRADQFAVAHLLKQFGEARIASFVTDERVELDLYGLQTPEAELAIASGSSIERVLFGRSPTNDSAHIFARQVTATNIVLVSTNILQEFRREFIDLRDRRLVAFAPETIDTIEVRADENFVLKKQADGTWMVAETPIDSRFVNDRLVALSQMQVMEFVKDVVSDFAQFALDPPQRRITLRTTITNGPVITNAIVTRLDFGTNKDPESVYARRADETSVYTIPAFHYQRLPSAVWQLRDHRVWSFTTNQVVRVVIRQEGETQQLLRQPNGSWAATRGDVLPYALDEMMFRLGELTAAAWVARGEAARTAYGFKPANYQISIDLKEGDQTRTVSIEFGGTNQLRIPYAATVIDGQPWIFEFPWQLLPDLQRHLSIPPPSANF